MNDRETLQSQLLYELHRLIFSSSDLVRGYAENLGLQERDAEALLIIWRAQTMGVPLAPSQLAHSLKITRSAVTYLVDRLVEKNLILRVPDVKDRRRSYLEISADSADIGHEFVDPINLQLISRFGSRTDEQLKALTEMLSDITETLISRSDDPQRKTNDTDINTRFSRRAARKIGTDAIDGEHSRSRTRQARDEYRRYRNEK